MRLLDLFCGAGGCAVGYARAGFAEIVGVDITPQRITGLSLEDVGAISAVGADAEGGYTPAEYEALWRRIHTYRGAYTGGDTRIVVRFELVEE